MDEGEEYCPECLRDVVANYELGRDAPSPVQTTAEQRQIRDAIYTVGKRLIAG